MTTKKNKIKERSGGLSSLLGKTRIKIQSLMDLGLINGKPAISIFIDKPK